MWRKIQSASKDPAGSGKKPIHKRHPSPASEGEQNLQHALMFWFFFSPGGAAVTLKSRHHRRRPWLCLRRPPTRHWKCRVEAGHPKVEHGSWWAGVPCWKRLVQTVDGLLEGRSWLTYVPANYSSQNQHAAVEVFLEGLSPQERHLHVRKC